MCFNSKNNKQNFSYKITVFIFWIFQYVIRLVILGLIVQNKQTR